MSKCTIGFLIHACQLSYRLDAKGNIDASFEKNNPDVQLKSHDSLKSHGYTQIDGTAQTERPGVEQSHLAAIALKPDNPNYPIVIAFRGTKTKTDLLSNFSIFKTGLAQSKQLAEAVKFYEGIKKQYPHRKIILTGHSLGGHIATYVALKAHEGNTVPSGGLLVRTFNTAPFSKKTCEQLKNNEFIKSKCINYRLSPDLISNINTYRYFGDIFSFKSKIKNPVDSHMLWAMDKELPDEVKQTLVSPESKLTLNETIQGFIHSYECRIQKQFFSSLRLGEKNLTILQKLQAQIMPLIKSENFQEAQRLINETKIRVKGRKSVIILEKMTNLLSGSQSNRANMELTKINTPKD